MTTRRVRSVVALAAALVCASCATSSPTTAPSNVGIPARGAQSNRVLTRTETTRLIGLARVPNSKRPITTVPKALSGPAGGLPSSLSLIDTKRVWRVPMSFDRAQTWLQNHPPAGLPQGGSSTSGSNGGTSAVGVTYGDHDTAAWTEAELDIGIAPDGSGHTYWRADGVALWLDPHPDTVRPGGRRRKITVAAGCPASDQGDVDVRPSGDATALVPSANATAGLICRYNGLNGDRSTLHSQSRLTAAQASHIADLALHVQLSHTKGGVYHCPADFGTAIVVSLSFAGRADVALFDRPTGCGSISNGTIRASGSQALTTALS